MNDFGAIIMQLEYAMSYEVGDDDIQRPGSHRYSPYLSHFSQGLNAFDIRM